MLIMDTLVEEAQDDHEIMNMGRMRQPPFKKRGIVRSLSSIIQGLRRQEDDKLDEELEMMREMEDADDDQGSAKPTVQVEDSQVVMPLGPDQSIESEESEEEERDTGVFRKPWKKKGLKRQTKRVISKSSRTNQQNIPNDADYSQCDLHQSPKPQHKLISAKRLLTTRAMLPKLSLQTLWTISTRMQIQMQRIAIRKPSVNDNSPRLRLETKMKPRRAPRAMALSRRQQRRLAPLPMPISDGSISRTRTRRRMAEADLVGSDDDVWVVTGVMHIWSLSAYEALGGKNTRAWLWSDTDSWKWRLGRSTML